MKQEDYFKNLVPAPKTVIIKIEPLVKTNVITLDPEKAELAPYGEVVASSVDWVSVGDVAHWVPRVHPLQSLSLFEVKELVKRSDEYSGKYISLFEHQICYIKKK